ncbi:MAG: alpha/beta fold hydrolase [Gemmatimonadetes bacterium]|nr:alpha/beta fold hydrolase [Gemmatimonadota bacterium]
MRNAVAAERTRPPVARVMPPWFRAFLWMLERVSPWLGGRVLARFFTTPGRHRTPAWEEELSATGRDRWIAGYHLTEWGPESGAPVVLLHGWEGRGAQLGYFVAPLTAAGVRVLALDGPAHGASPGRNAGPYHFARALCDVQCAVGPFRAAVGHSMGGAALTLALGDGLQLGKAIILGSPSHFTDVRDRYLHMVGAGPRSSQAFHAEMLRRLGLTHDTPSLREIARTQSLPVLVVHDPEDREVPVVDARATAAAYRNARLLELDAGGHRRMLKAPAVIAAVTEFILTD